MQTDPESAENLGQWLWRTFLAGLLTVLPLAVTLIVIIWLARKAESVFGTAAKTLMPNEWYVPGMGILLAVVFVFLVGAFLHAWFVNRVVELGERQLERIPGIKTIYSGMRDVLDFISRKGERTDMKHVVAVEVQPEAHLIGFVTDEAAGDGLQELARTADDPLVAVYFPMGYQIGGYTLYLPASRLRSLDLSVEQAMRVILTAGVNRPQRAGEPEAQPEPEPEPVSRPEADPGRASSRAS